jgi:hypothetical protein
VLSYEATLSLEVDTVEMLLRTCKYTDNWSGQSPDLAEALLKKRFKVICAEVELYELCCTKSCFIYHHGMVSLPKPRPTHYRIILSPLISVTPHHRIPPRLYMGFVAQAKTL